MDLLKLFNNRVIKIGLLLLLLFQFYKIPYHLLGVDAGAILPTARDVVKFNKLPYIDLFTIYTPLSYYFYGFLYYFFEVPPMYVIIVYNWLFLIIAALILRKGVTKNYRDLISLLFLLLISPLAFDVKIETIAMPFLVYLSLKTAELLLINNFRLMLRRVILIGFLCSILFLFKQYYLLLLPEIFLVLLLCKGFTGFSSKNKIAILFGWGASFLFSTFVFFLLFIHFNFSDFNFNDLLIQLQGKNYNECSPFVTHNSFFDVVFSYFRYIILLMPIALAVLVLLPFAKGFKNFFFFLLIFFLPLNLFWFNIQPQYTFIILPFVIILFIGIFNNKIDGLYFKLNKSRVTFLLSVISLTIAFYILRNHVYSDFTYIKYSNRKEEYSKFLAEGSRIQNLVGNEKNVYLGKGINKLFVYHLNFKSVDEKKMGYIFLTSDCFDNVLKSGEKKGIILINENNSYLRVYSASSKKSILKEH